MKTIICKDKKTIDKITNILAKNDIEFSLIHQYCFVNKINLLQDESGIFLVYYLQYKDTKLKKIYKDQINFILG